MKNLLTISCVFNLDHGDKFIFSDIRLSDSCDMFILMAFTAFKIDFEMTMTEYFS